MFRSIIHPARSAAVRRSTFRPKAHMGYLVRPLLPRFSTGNGNENHRNVMLPEKYTMSFKPPIFKRVDETKDSTKSKLNSEGKNIDDSRMGYESEEPHYDKESGNYLILDSLIATGMIIALCITIVVSYGSSNPGSDPEKEFKNLETTP